jgi:hypothetical protein
MCAGCDPGPVCEYQWADGVTIKKVIDMRLFFSSLLLVAQMILVVFKPPLR